MPVSSAILWGFEIAGYNSRYIQIMTLRGKRVLKSKCEKNKIFGPSNNFMESLGVENSC